MGSFNIFDPSSHPKKKPKAPPPAQKTLDLLKRKREFKDPEIISMLNRINELKSDLNGKIQNLMDKGGHTPSSIKKYLYDPVNFTPKEWQLIQKHRDIIEKEVGLSLQPIYKKAKVEKETKVMGKERKGKTLGTRKRWLDMR